MIKKIIRWLFSRHIDQIVDERIEEMALDKYIDAHLSITNGLTSPELQFRGKKIVKIFASCLYELVKDSDNYVAMDLICEGYEPLIVTIQKRWGESPHEIAEKHKKMSRHMSIELDRLRGGEK